MTLKELAEKIGISKTAVSLVLNNKPNNISPKMREKIFLEAKNNNYTPNHLAKALRTNKTRIIGVVMPGISLSFYAEYVEQLEQILFKTGYSALMSFYGGNKTPNNAISNLVSRGVDGMILFPTGAKVEDEILNKLSRIPTLCIDGAINELKIPMVSTDYKKGGSTATNFLLNNGHKKIACIIGNQESYSCAKKLEGHYDAMKRLGNDFDFSSIFAGCYDAESGYRAASNIINAGFSAVFCFDDVTAYGLYKHFQEQQVKIGEDISVIGFDNLFSSSYIEVPLTTLAHDVEQLAEISALKLFAQIENGTVPKHNILVEPTLIVRNSVGRII